MIIICVMSGRLTKAGELSWGTLLKLQVAMLLARQIPKGVPYMYVFPQGRRDPVAEAYQQRPCDTMRTFVIKHDPRCSTVVTPDYEHDLNTREEKGFFVEDVADDYLAMVLRLRQFFSVRKVQKKHDDYGSGDWSDPFPAQIVTTLNVVPLFQKDQKLIK